MTDKNSSDFLDMIAHTPLTMDGAMGTLLYERGILIHQCFEHLNITHRDIIDGVHRLYLSAGANVIETNTFGANPFKLKPYGLENKIYDITYQGTIIARECAGDNAFVAGSIGPSGLSISGLLLEAQRNIFLSGLKEQVRAFENGGADFIIFETITHLIEMEIAIPYVKSLTTLPIGMSIAFDDKHLALDGTTPEQVCELAESWGVNIVGANCSEGPDVLLAVAEKMRKATSIPICIQPNAGSPRRYEGRLMYMSTPEYFGLFAKRCLKLGVNLIGGCCGTTPEHIKSIALSVRMRGGNPSIQIAQSRSKKVTLPLSQTLKSEALSVVPLDQRSKLGKALQKEFIVSVEVNPPSGLDPQKSIDAVKMLHSNGIRFINVADGPRATARMDNGAFAMKIRDETGIEPLIHVCCRDRNILGLQSDLIAYHVYGMNNLVIITGDPPKVGDYPWATAVYDVDSIGLLQIVDSLNRGIDPAGKPLHSQTSFVLGTGAEPSSLNYEREMERLRMKVKAGANFIMTQPVYDINTIHRFLRDTKDLNIPIIVGFLPLVSHRNAEFLHNEVPGISIPKEIMERMKIANTGEAAKKEGVKIIQEIITEIKNEVQGIYLMPPLGKYELAVDIIQIL